MRKIAGLSQYFYVVLTKGVLLEAFKSTLIGDVISSMRSLFEILNIEMFTKQVLINESI